MGRCICRRTTRTVVDRPVRTMIVCSGWCSSKGPKGDELTMNVFARLVRRWPVLFAAPLVLLLAAGTAVLTPHAAAGPAPDPQTILTQASPAVGVVRGVVGTRKISGTAFVIDRERALPNAAHVARGAEQLQVDLRGLAALDARVIGYDATRDLAILRVSPPSPLAALQLAGDTLNVGDPVVVIGAPRGLPDQITAGEVLATRISIPGLVPEIFVRVSAAVRRGNSGSPLLNSQAQVVGVVVAASFDRARASLAVSEETIRAVLPQLRQGARAERAWLGIIGGRPREAAPGAAPGQGAVVRQMMPQSPAAAAGLRPGDVGVEFEGAAIHNWRDLLAAVGQPPPGRDG